MNFWRFFIFSKRKIAQVTLILFLTISTASFFQIGPQQIAQSVSTTVKKQCPIYFVYTNEPKVGLSFDAAWGAERTEEILDILSKYQIKATFFLTNIWLEDYPEMAKKIVQQGHEIGMHSANHPHMNAMSSEEIQKELDENHQMIVQITGYEPQIFRFPFGEYNNQSLNIVKSNGYAPIQWSIDSLDWQESSSKADIVERVTENMNNGAIILCHNNGTFTADALIDILEYANNHNFSMVPIGKLIYHGDYTIDQLGGQRQ